MMEHEHDSAGERTACHARGQRRLHVRHRMRASATRRFTRRWRDFEADLHQHIHLENNILFPRAIAMEKTH